MSEATMVASIVLAGIGVFFIAIGTGDGVVDRRSVRAWFLSGGVVFTIPFLVRLWILATLG